MTSRQPSEASHFTSRAHQRCFLKRFPFTGVQHQLVGPLCLSPHNAHSFYRLKLCRKPYTSVQALAHGAAPPVQILSPACNPLPCCDSLRLPHSGCQVLLRSQRAKCPQGLRNATTGTQASKFCALLMDTYFTGRGQHKIVFTYLSSRETVTYKQSTPSLESFTNVPY